MISSAFERSSVVIALDKLLNFEHGAHAFRAVFLLCFRPLSCRFKNRGIA